MELVIIVIAILVLIFGFNAYLWNKREDEKLATLKRIEKALQKPQDSI